MEGKQEARGGSAGLQEAIVTLPMAGIALLGLLCAAMLAAAGWLARNAEHAEVQSKAFDLALLAVPLITAVIVAVAIRRTSTRQVDRLITAFLEKTVIERLQIWTRADQHAPWGGGYPFDAVRLVTPTQGRSYAYYALRWRGGAQGESLVGLKANVFNFEVLARLPLELPPGVAVETDAVIATAQSLERIASHPVLRKFMGIVQGSVNEGYEVKAQFNARDDDPGRRLVDMDISLRQKTRENFLASTFLKRYYAEDAAIAIGVLFQEWQGSGFAPRR